MKGQEQSARRVNVCVCVCVRERLSVCVCVGGDKWEEDANSSVKILMSQVFT